MIERQVLRNNVTLITQSVPSSRTVAIGFFFATGSRYEGDGNHGASHFCEHLLFKGTRTRSTHDIACAFDQMGGTVNAFTERDTVCMHCLVPADGGNVRRALEVFCDMASSCTFPAEEVERERAVIINEIHAVQDDGEESALDAAAAVLWPQDALGLSITGTEAEVRALTRERLRAWYGEHFVRGELCVCACGAVLPGEVRAVLERLPPHKPPVGLPPGHLGGARARWQSGTFFERSRCAQVHLFCWYPFDMPLSQAQYSALLVLNALAGDSMSSRLFETLRERGGLCYAVYSFFACYEDGGAWCAYAACDAARAVQAAGMLAREMSVLLAAPERITDEELSAAKEHVCGEEIMGGEDMEYCMKRAQRFSAMGLPLLDTEQVVAGIRAVTRKSVEEFARTLLQKEKRMRFVYGKRLSVRARKKIRLQGEPNDE